MLKTASSLTDDDNINSEALSKLNSNYIPPNLKVAKAKEVNNLKEKLKLPAIPVAEKSTTRDLNTLNSTMGAGGSTYSNNTSTITPSKTTPTSAPTSETTSTHLPMTTTTITSTTTATSSTINLNVEGIRESFQENLHKNLIEREESFKKSLPSKKNDNEKDSDFENFSEETIKSTKFLETSTITNDMKQYSSPLNSYKSSTTTFTLPLPPNPSHENLNALPSFDIVDDSIDFLELIEDDKSSNRLFKILEHNNITLEELIEHRQLHLSTIVESSPRFYTDEKSALQDNMDIVTVIENLPHFSLFNLKSVKPYNIKTDSEHTNYLASTIDIENSDEV